MKRLKNLYLFSFLLAISFLSLGSFSSYKNTLTYKLNKIFPDRVAEIKVPEGYTVEMVASPDLVDYPMFGTLDETGRLFLFESVVFIPNPIKILTATT